jgi:ribokinase
MSRPRVVVVGSSNTDLIVRADRLPMPGETVLGGDLTTAAGGKGANQAVAAARLGAHVTFVGRVGQDMFGQQTLEAFLRQGLDLQYLRQDPSAPSGVALIVVGPGGENIIAVAPGANRNLSPADVAAAQPAIAQARVMMLQLEIPIHTVLAAARAAREAGLIVILNPAPAEALPAPLYEAVDVLTPNEREAAQLTGLSPEQSEAAAQELLARGVGTVIVTLGEVGVLVARRGETPRRAPGFHVQAVDSTAAGDAFNGGLATALARGDALDDAVHYAQAVAAISVTRPGAQPSLPSAEEVAQFLARQNPVHRDPSR